ncbi:hypothetical protein RRG08_059374 [Elysia crispata]|uniref:Uncharacterized protein n=1 Tax=Elysia crispata TaxID=231223 RepID=A0AAE1EE91_9GAST|nr:hypothetical protein RRG08_059374 [Elysia crispata]
MTMTKGEAPTVRFGVKMDLASVWLYHWWRLTPLADTFSAIFPGPVSLALLSPLTGPPNSIIPSIKPRQYPAKRHLMGAEC